MQVKRFVAKDMRRALELVRQNLGEDAVILSSRRVREGVEILTRSDKEEQAAPETASGSLFPDQEQKLGKSPADIVADIELASRRLAARQQVEASAAEYLTERQVVNAGIPVRAGLLSTPNPVAKSTQNPDAKPGRFVSAAERYGLLDEEPEQPNTKKHQVKADPKPAAAEPVRTQAAAKSQDEIASLQEEILHMRRLLEERLASVLPGDGGEPRPRKVSTISQRISDMGFSERLTQALFKKPLKQALIAKAWPEALARLSKAIPVLDTDMTANGGMYAFVGPTGAGKTTTIAKLAARYVMRHGADKVALVTTDTRRLAAQDQLRSLAAILKVPLRVVDDNNSLPQVLRSLRKVELVLIDTAGLRHGDPALKAQMKTLAQIPRVRSVLVLPANSQRQMLKASVHAYGGANLKACVLSKLDETASVGEAIECAMQARLPIAYTTDGQDIPDDIAVAKGPSLLSKAAALGASNGGAPMHKKQRANQVQG